MTRQQAIEALNVAGIGATDETLDELRPAVERLLPEPGRSEILDAIDGRVEVEQLNLRASSMPLIMVCPGAARIPSVRIHEGGDAANLGSAVHRALRAVVAGVGVPWDEMSAIATQYGCDEDELRMLCAMGSKLWGQIRESFPLALTEVQLSYPLGQHAITGTADILSVADPSVVRVADWKTGRKDHDYSQQLRAYAALAMTQCPDATNATATILWVRSGEIENYTMTRAQALLWLDSVAQNVICWKGTYEAGPHCQHCPRSHECEAASAMMRRDAALIGTDAEAIATMQPADVLRLYHAADAAAKAAKRVHEAIKGRVLQAGDIAAGGSVLTIDTEKRRRLDTIKAWPILDEVLEDELSDCVSISISEVEKRAAKRAGRGKGAAAVRDLGDRLAKAEAIGIGETRKLALKRGA